MRLTFAIMLSFTLLGMGGCASGGSGDSGFSRSFTAVSTGATKNQVRAALGDPDNRMQRSRLATTLAKTPPELERALPPGTPYEMWLYRRGQTDYRLYFASGSGAPVEQWKLVGRRAVPNGSE